MRIQGQSKAILTATGSNAYPIYATGDITINDSDVTAASAKQAFNKGGKIIPASGKAMSVDQGDAQASATHHGPLGYAKWALSSSSNENLRYAMMALYRYNQSAKEYFV